MAKVLVFQYVAHEPLGIFDPMLREGKHRIIYVNFYHHPESQPCLKGYKGLIVLGGLMTPENAISKYHTVEEEKKSTEQYLPRSMQLARTVFGEFINLLPNVNEKTLLQSRG